VAEKETPGAQRPPAADPLGVELVRPWLRKALQHPQAQLIALIFIAALAFVAIARWIEGVRPEAFALTLVAVIVVLFILQLSSLHRWLRLCLGAAVVVFFCALLVTLRSWFSATLLPRSVASVSADSPLVPSTPPASPHLPPAPTGSLPADPRGRTPGERPEQAELAAQPARAKRCGPQQHWSKGQCREGPVLKPCPELTYVENAGPNAAGASGYRFECQCGDERLPVYGHGDDVLQARALVDELGLQPRCPRAR
jgi:hypothetical protein